MTDPIAQAAVTAPSVQTLPSNAALSTPPAPFAPAETKMFATLMQGAAPNIASASGGTPGALSDVAASLTTQFGKTRTFEEIRHSMLSSFDPSDPIKSMFAMTSDGMEAQMLFTKLHISTSLASAATSLFGSLLKNQQ